MPNRLTPACTRLNAMRFSNLNNQLLPARLAPKRIESSFLLNRGKTRKWANSESSQTPVPKAILRNCRY